MKTAEPPKAGWGILKPDPEVLPETLELIERMGSLPDGQRDALLTRAVPRHIFVEEGLDAWQEASKSQMVRCSGALSHLWFDLIGKP